MAETSAIEWTEATWNPWRGCRKVSPGCKFCYMFRDQERYGKDPRMVVRAAPATFKAPQKWKDPKTIFTCSWSDWFIEEADGWRQEAWGIIKQTPHHTYQILTKRADRIADNLPGDWGMGYDNVWLGTSVENADYKHRIDALRDVPAKVRFLSVEPMLGPLGDIDLTGIHWVIVGGESGYPGQHRPMELDWARGVRDQCIKAGVAFFLKQLGGTVHDKRGGDKALLDGVRWTQMPTTTARGEE